MATGRLRGKTAIITGGTRGMGAAHARAFVKEGACVVITGNDEEAGKAVVSELGDAAIFVRQNVASAANWSCSRPSKGSDRSTSSSTMPPSASLPRSTT